jgi:hypothetical protein
MVPLVILLPSGCHKVAHTPQWYFPQIREFIGVTANDGIGLA